MIKIDKDVINVLANSIIEENKLFLPQEQLERNLYLAVDKILKATGGKWNRKEKAHLFSKDVKDIIEEIVLTEEYSDTKKEYQFFETPFSIAKELVQLANVKQGETVLEPSAGKGRIASLISNCHCIELNDDNRAYLEKTGYRVVGKDFMTFTKRYDVIIANPPFSKQQDIDHINHMIDLANRKVVSVASSSILFRNNKKTVLFRDKINLLGGTIKNLPEKSFVDSGTNVNACIICVKLPLKKVRK